MTNDKTIKEWFEWADSLGFIWAKYALHRAKLESNLNNIESSLAEALYRGFSWKDTEKPELWADIYQHLQKISNKQFI